MIQKDLKLEIEAEIKRIKNDPEVGETNPEELFEEKRFQVEDLDGFSVDAKGVTFTYDYVFPHVIKALEPDGTFTYTWEQMRPYIKTTGLLARLAR